MSANNYFISFIEDVKCAWKDCPEKVYPTIVVFATDQKTAGKASKLINQFTRHYCPDHFIEIKKKYKSLKADTMKQILEDPSKDFFLKTPFYEK